MLKSDLPLPKSQYIVQITSEFPTLSFTAEEKTAVMSDYHKMDTNKYPNTFGCHIIYQTNIQIYSNATYLYSGNSTNMNMNNIQGSFYSNFQIFVLITELFKGLTHASSK